MKGINMLYKLLISLAFTIVITGCAQSSYSVGNDFSTEYIEKIEKGRTTTKELNEWFGEPYSKSVLSASKTKWMYVYTSGTAKVQSYVFTANVETKGTQKVLDLLIEDDIVVNYTFTNTPSSNITTTTN